MRSERPIPPGLTPERAGFFTDAVFAIATTLLVIDIPKPGEGSGLDASDAGPGRGRPHHAGVPG